MDDSLIFFVLLTISLKLVHIETKLWTSELVLCTLNVQLRFSFLTLFLAHILLDELFPFLGNWVHICCKKNENQLKQLFICSVHSNSQLHVPFQGCRVSWAIFSHETAFFRQLISCKHMAIKTCKLDFQYNQYEH